MKADADVCIKDETVVDMKRLELDNGMPGVVSGGSHHLPAKRGSSFGPSGMTISVKDLTFSVKSNIEKGKTVHLLKNVTGFFEPNKMSALMGPSGSGKTTLLDILAGRKTSGKTEGTILFAGNKPTRQFLRRYTGYVEQFDTLLPTLTVEEMLMYTAELKRPISEPLSEKKAAVDELIDKLALESCRKVPIGSSMSKGISGGQAKRTNIGIALITNPRVLFLDEPTSGLDSFTSNEVMTVVKALVSDGVTIVATIHSPTAYAFNLFDKLMMLVKGRVVYFGAQGKPALEYVRTQCPQIKEQSSGYGSDAEWLVDLFTEADRMGKGGEFADAYDVSQLKKDNDYIVDSLCAQKHVLPAHVQQELSVKTETVTPWWWGIKTLIKYRTTHNYRDAAFLGPRIGDKLLIGLLIMTLYLGIGDDFAPDNVINIAAVNFMFVTMPAFGAAAYVPAIVLERNLFCRERNDGVYRVITYLMAKMLDELMIAAVASCVIAAIAFYGIQLQGEFVLFWLVYYIVLCTGIVLAYFVAALSPNMDVANAALPTYVTSLLFFGGFLFTFDKMPVWWKWYSYIDVIRYAWTAIMVNQFEGRDAQMFSGQTVLQYYGIEGQNKWANLGYTACFFFFFTFCAWVTLSVKKYQRR
eukprot:jgi/Chrzof1/13895/Cz08g16130.t1